MYEASLCLLHVQVPIRSSSWTEDRRVSHGATMSACLWCQELWPNVRWNVCRCIFKLLLFLVCCMFLMPAAFVGSPVFVSFCDQTIVSWAWQQLPTRQLRRNAFWSFCQRLWSHAYTAVAFVMHTYIHTYIPTMLLSRSFTISGTITLHTHTIQ